MNRNEIAAAFEVLADDTLPTRVFRASEKIRAWLEELEARLGTARCAYCPWSERHGGTFEDMRARLVAHAAVCPGHPLRALEADNAALERELRAVLAVLWGPDFERRPAELSALRVLAQPHPGAVLLAEHKKALVCARNEGVERVAALRDSEASTAREKASLYAGQPIANEWARTAKAAEAEAERIRSLKEPERCCERDYDGDGNCDRHPARRHR